MMGVASYQAPDLFKRVVILSISNFFAMLVLAGSWWDKSKLDRCVLCVRACVCVVLCVRACVCVCVS